MWAPAPAQANWLGTNGSGTGRSAAAITRSRAGLTYRIKAIFNIVKRAPDGGDPWDIHGRAGIRENRRRLARGRSVRCGKLQMRPFAAKMASAR